MSRRFPWLTPRHEEELVKARAILVGLLQVGSHEIDPVQSNSEEHEAITEIVSKIERLLGY